MLIKRKCDSCRKNKNTHLSLLPAGPSKTGDIPPIVHDVLSSPGKPLDPSIQAYMESRFNFNFSQVRVHSDSKAAESAKYVSARAYTVGTHVILGSGSNNYHTLIGKKLLAHELAHVVQQSRGGSVPLQNPSSFHEHGADIAAEAVARGELVPHVIGSTAIGIARQADPNYVKPTFTILKIMDEMADEIAALRASAKPATSALEESSRTYCIVKVVDAIGKVKVTTTGAFMGGSIHAEQMALNKLDLSQISEMDTVLLMVDQYPCSDKCKPFLLEFREKVPGEFRVFTKVKVDREKNKSYSPKTSAIAKDKSMQELNELIIFQKRPNVTGVTEKPGISDQATSKMTPPEEQSVTTTFKAKTARTVKIPPPEISLSGREMRDIASAAVQDLKKEFRILRTARIINSILGMFQFVFSILMLIDFMEMALSGNAGKGFIFTEYIKKTKAMENEFKTLNSSYKPFSDSIKDFGVKLFKISTDPSVAADFLPSIWSMIVFLNGIRDRVKDTKSGLAKRIDAIKTERSLREKILSDRQRSGIIGGFTVGSGTLAVIHAETEDLTTIQISLSSTLMIMNNLEDYIESDVSFLNDWIIVLFNVCAKAGKCGIISPFSQNDEAIKEGE